MPLAKVKVRGKSSANRQRGLRRIIPITHKKRK